MHPLVRGAAAVAILTALGSLERPPAEPAASAPGVDPGAPAACPPHTVPDGDICVRIPSGEPRAAATAPDRRADDSHERIPRRPDRAAGYGAYRFPFETPAGSGPRLLEPPGEALALATTKGAPITLVSLENQKGDAAVVFVGDTPAPDASAPARAPIIAKGTTIATLHDVTEGGRTQTYLLVLSGLASVEAPVVAGAHLSGGALLGHAGDALHIATRLVREGKNLEHLEAARLDDAALSVSTDPRNVLPLR